RHHCDDRESGRAPQAANGIAKILKHTIHWRSSCATKRCPVVRLSARSTSASWILDGKPVTSVGGGETGGLWGLLLPDRRRVPLSPKRRVVRQRLAGDVA